MTKLIKIAKYAACAAGLFVVFFGHGEADMRLLLWLLSVYLGITISERKRYF